MKVLSSSLTVAHAVSVTAPRATAQFIVQRNAEATKERNAEARPTPCLPPKPSTKKATSTNWRKNIEHDVQALWRSLHRLVSLHPLVRTTLSSQQSSTGSVPIFSTHDLTQDLYLLLLEKGRFSHYLQAQMSDAEIEREIYQIELTNFLIGRLRRRRPENYRIVRRVSAVLESAPQFKVFNQKSGQSGRYRQAPEVVYGLREWAASKPLKDAGTFAELITHLPMRARNRRIVGCRGEAQVIVTNQELTELMAEILRAIDSPAPLRILRQLALSKLPVYDAEISSIDDDVNEDGEQRQKVAFMTTDVSPEQAALAGEDAQLARQTASAFLERLYQLTKANQQRTERLWQVLWHCFFDPSEPSQLQIADSVGISDSSVSDYRRKLEAELRKLKLSVEQLPHFTEELNEQLRWRLCLVENSTVSQSAESEALPPWMAYNFGAGAARPREVWQTV